MKLSRRAFSVLSSAGVALGAGARAAGAQADFGRPHPPIVAEDDPAITVSRPAISSGGRLVSAYAAAPRDAPGAPNVVVVQAIWGVDAQLRDTVRRFAKEGYAAMAPDLYAGLNAPSGDGATDFAPYREVAAKLVDGTVDQDLAATADYARAGRARAPVGVAGFCMGGGIALRQTLDDARFAAAAIFYGKVSSAPASYAEHVTVPLVGSWGERDTSIPAEDVRAFAATLAARKLPHDVKIYPEAAHAFFDDTRNSYVASAAADAWTRTLHWFGRHLR